MRGGRGAGSHRPVRSTAREVTRTSSARSTGRRPGVPRSGGSAPASPHGWRGSGCRGSSSARSPSSGSSSSAGGCCGPPPHRPRRGCRSRRRRRRRRRRARAPVRHPRRRRRRHRRRCRRRSSCTSPAPSWQRGCTSSPVALAPPTPWRRPAARPPGSDVDALNLAAPLRDGERVYVPVEGEAPPPLPAGDVPGSSVAPGPVDLNRATAAGSTPFRASVRRRGRRRRRTGRRTVRSPRSTTSSRSVASGRRSWPRSARW